MSTISAFSEAIKNFQQGDPDEMAKRAGASYYPDKETIIVKYFNQEVSVDWPTGKLSCAAMPLDTNDKVLILQYLISACTIKQREQWISFIQLPDGPNHHQPFILEATQPIAAQFGENTDGFRAVCKEFGGVDSELGEAGFIIYALPRIPLAVCLWTEDDEFPANANILFDSTASLHLTTAALWVLGIELSRKLRGTKGQQFSKIGRQEEAE